MKMNNPEKVRGILEAYENTKTFVEKIAYCAPYSSPLNAPIGIIKPNQSTMMHTFVMRMIAHLHAKFSVDLVSNKEICLQHIWNDCMVLQALIKSSNMEYPQDLVCFVNRLPNEMRLSADNTTAIKIAEISSFTVNRISILDTLGKWNLKEYKFLSEIAVSIATRDSISYGVSTDIYEILAEERTQQEYVLEQITGILAKYEKTTAKFIDEDIVVILGIINK